MKRRIISLILVVALSLLALTSCGYSFVNDDMKNYATFNNQALIDALKAIEIENADFGVNEAERLQKVEDAIFTTLAGKVDTTDKKTSGKPGSYDVLYYCYYITYEKDGKPVYILSLDNGKTSTIKESSATKLQLSLSSNKDLTAKIEEALKDVDLKNVAYATTTGGTVVSGDMLAVSYKKSYTEKVKDKDGNVTDKAVTVTVTNEFLTATTPADSKTKTTFTDHLVGLTIGSAKKEEIKVKEDINGETVEVTYTAVTPNWKIKSGMNSDYKSTITVKDKTYTDTKKVTDVYGNKDIELKNVELTYHIFPVYYLDVASELTATIVVKDLIGTSITASTDTNKNGKIDEDEKSASLDVFDDAGYKKGDKTVTALVEELKTLYTELTDLEAAVDKEETNVEAAQKAIDDAKKAGQTVTDNDTLSINLKTAKDALAAAEGKVTEKKTAIDNKIAEIVGTAKDGKSIDTVIVTQYREQRYEGLENTYKNAIKTSIAKEIYKVVKANVKFKTDAEGRPVLPQDAVNEVYKTLVNDYKYDFYEGTSTVSGVTVSNYTANGGDFNKFLKTKLGLKTTDPMQKVYDKIGAEAEEIVKQKIIVYVFADACGEIFNTEIKATNEDIQKYKDTVEYNIYLYQYFGMTQYQGMTADDMPRSDYETVATFDKALNYLLEEKEGEKPANPTDEDNTVKYVRVTYKFVEKTDDKDDDDHSDHDH